MKNVVTAPLGFVPRQQWPESHLPATMPQIFKPETIQNGSVGVRWRCWPFFFEEYTSDVEPDFKIGHRPDTRWYVRIIKWHRISRTDVPQGWRRFAKRPYVAVGYAELAPGDVYSASWSESARRARKKWLELQTNGIFRIEPITWEAYENTYQKSVVGGKIGSLILDTIAATIRAGGGEHVVCYGVKGGETGEELLAGIAVLNSPSCKSSYYLAGFFMPKTEDTPLMAGLFDHWFGISEKQGIRFLHFGHFWLPGNSSSWKGFSNFKAKFGAKILVYQPLLFRIMFG